MRQTLQDRNHHVIGYIDTEFSGRQTLLCFRSKSYSVFH